MTLPEQMEKARAFHGHLGPWLVLGLRIGQEAVEAVGARRYFGLALEVHVPPQPPPSCILDGLQLSTGCTFGKRNIELRPADDGRVWVRARNTDTGDEALFQVSAEFPGEARSRMQADGEESASLWTWEADALYSRVEAPEG
ncbi:MAG TPA: formylmethanofuran dehydrogenase subunit E family protein [Armatimonadota bacterium]